MAFPFFNDAVTTPVDVTHSSQRVWGVRLVNTTAAVAYLAVYNVPAASVVAGTTLAVFHVRLQANESLVMTPQDAMTVGDGLLPAPSASPKGLSIAGLTAPNGLVNAAISVLMLTA